MATKTTTTKSYVTYIVASDKTKQYLTDLNGERFTMNCKASKRDYTITLACAKNQVKLGNLVISAEDLGSLDVKFQTEEAYENMIDRARKTQERKETRASSREGKQALDLVNKIHSAIHTTKDETRKKRNKAVFSLVDGLNIQGESRREKFLSVIASYEALGIEIHDDIVNFINSL